MRTRVPTLLLAALATAALADPALAHASGLSGQDAGSAPFWFVLLTGGAVVGGSFLFATLLTDHEAIRMVNGWRLSVRIPGGVRRFAGALVGTGSVAVLAAVVTLALFGPAHAESNAAVLLVWAGWWAGYTITVYLLADSWPAIDPWRRIARILPQLGRPYPDRLGSWPAVAGLLGLVWLEVVSPVSENPRLLGLVVAGYTTVTLAGAAAYGRETWFGNVDPIAAVFRCFGRIAPVQRTDDGFAVGLPTSSLARPAEHGADETAFVVALLWATTYDGIVSTPAWTGVAEVLVGVGIPALLLYLALLVAGFAVFLWIYGIAAGRSRRSADSLVSAEYVRRWFAPSLLPIAAGYHLAHFLGYFVQLSGQLVTTLAAPTTATPLTLVPLPGWFASLQLVFVVTGHLFAIWVAHSLSFELFPGRLQPIRSQYPFTVVMIFYTMTSMWIVAQPHSPPPYV